MTEVAEPLPRAVPSRLRRRTASQWLTPARGPVAALALVAVLYAVLIGVALRLHVEIWHDDAIYLSQFDPSHPNIPWAPWRAWGMPLIVAPVAVFSPSFAVVRAYIVACYAVGL